MRFWKILVVAFGAQLIVLGSGAAIAGLGGVGMFGPALSGWLDVLNTFIPLWFAACLVGVGLVAFSFERRRARTAILALGGVGLLVSGTPIAIELAARGLQAMGPTGSGAPLRILTFNSFKENFVPAMAVETILNSGADIVALQEPKGVKRFRPALSRVYPYQTDCPGLECDVVILAKRRPLAMGVTQLPRTLFEVIGSSPDEYMAMARIDFTAPDGRPATLVSTHLGWPAPPGARQWEQNRLADYLRPLAKQRLILTGDFNATPWAFAMHRQDWGLRPMRRVTRALPTWPAYIPRIYYPLMIQLLPIDHIYVGPGWRVSRLQRLRRSASDHVPVLAELRPD